MAGIEGAILDIIKRVVSPDSSNIEIFAILSIIVMMLSYKYFIKPALTEVKRVIKVIQDQNENLKSVNVVVMRLESNIIGLKKSFDEDAKVNQTKIDESQKDINEIKMILAQFQGALNYNNRIFNKELE